MNLSLLIIVATALISILAFQQADVMKQLQFTPYLVKRRQQWYRFISHAFVHADWLHLILNMMVLYFFGPWVELAFHYWAPEWYKTAYMSFYFSAVLVAIISSYRKHSDDAWYHSVGASGAVSAVVFASVVFEPWNKIYLYGIIGIPGILLAVGYVGYSYSMARKANDRINHEAHLWGALYGLVFPLILFPEAAANFLFKLQNPSF